ncbi:hypothetical protein [Sphingobacterium sp. MYb382]|uniref:hypothetical protein n=1 Tax=Sphingobacterium sp. MYb382 TaxID=2745278 RepID=UPI0030A31C84
MKKLKFIAILSGLFFVATSCSKNDPTPETDQEEVGTATLTFTEVERESHGDHFHYNDIKNPEVEIIKFSGTNLLPAVGSHAHLELGKTYRLTLTATDFAGRETQQTFVQRADIHQAFLIGAPEGSLTYVYADKDADGKNVQVGVTGYITVDKIIDKPFLLRYIIRHLNPGVKAKITAADWNNVNFAQFTGENDLDLKAELHLVQAGHDHD